MSGLAAIRRVSLTGLAMIMVMFGLAIAQKAVAREKLDLKAAGKGTF